MTKSIYEKTNFAMVQVVFISDYRVPEDLSGKRVLAMVGGGAALGNWDPNDGPRGIEYPPSSGKWYITTWLPADENVECKLALVSPGPGYVRWETGPNKHIPGRSLDGTVELAWGSDQPRFTQAKLPKEIAFCTIMTRHWLPDGLHLKMVGSFHTIGDWNILKAPKTRLVPGSPDWRYTCVALPKRTDVEWKWGVCRPDGSNAAMERWTNRFTLLNSKFTSNYLINAPWEVYALVMEIMIPKKIHSDDDFGRPYLDISPSSSGHGSSLPSPDSMGEFQNFKGNPSPGGASGGGALRTNGWYNGGRQCSLSPKSGKAIELSPQTIELLRTLLKEDEEDEKREEQKQQQQQQHQHPQGDRSPKRASRVSPLPPIEELSPEREEDAFCQEVLQLEGNVVADIEADLENELDLEQQEGKEEGESCYGSMATIESRESERQGVVPDYDHEGTETSPSSDEMNLECRNTLYGNEKVARSCQEVSHWLLNYTQEPIRKSSSLDVGMFPGRDRTAARDVSAEMEVCDELDVEQNSEENLTLVPSGSTTYTTFPSGWTVGGEDQFIQADGSITYSTTHAYIASFTSACVHVMSSLFRNVMREAR